jgi:hypothetical protein
MRFHKLVALQKATQKHTRYVLSACAISVAYLQHLSRTYLTMFFEFVVENGARFGREGEVVHVLGMMRSLCWTKEEECGE